MRKRKDKKVKLGSFLCRIPVSRPLPPRKNLVHHHCAVRKGLFPGATFSCWSAALHYSILRRRWSWVGWKDRPSHRASTNLCPGIGCGHGGDISAVQRTIVDTVVAMGKAPLMVGRASGRTQGGRASIAGSWRPNGAPSFLVAAAFTWNRAARVIWKTGCSVALATTPGERRANEVGER